MSNMNEAMIEKYRSNFLKEVEANVEEGNWVKMCMQCGVCSGSCPLGPHWDHPPQELFMMIRAGKREEVLTSTSMWMCTSCYNCIARCPRGLPITHIMHGLASYAKRLGLAPKNQPTLKFGDLFWNSIVENGRVNELKIGVGLYFMNGFGEGVKNALAGRELGMAMMKTGRMNAMEYFGGHKCKDRSGIAKMLKKAEEFEKFHNLATPYSLAATTSYAKVSPTTTAGGSPTGFTEGTDAKLTYTGTVSIDLDFVIQAVVDQRTGSNKDVTLALYKNGVIVTNAETIVTTTSGKKQQLNLQHDVTAAQNDYFEIYAKISSAATVNFYSVQLFASTAGA